MVKLQEDRISRNERRLDVHSSRLDELEKSNIIISKDSENLTILMEKLEKSISNLDMSVNKIMNEPDYTRYELNQLTDKVEKLSDNVDNLMNDDAEKWKHYSKLVMGAILTTIVGYILGGMIP